MTENEIFRKALEEIAADGNAKAAFALELAGKSTNTSTAQYIINELRGANTKLQSALRRNGNEWTTDTDDFIQEAQSSILNAVSAAGKLA